MRERGFWVFFVRGLSLYTEFLVHEAPKLLFDPVCFFPRFGVLNTLCLVSKNLGRRPSEYAVTMGFVSTKRIDNTRGLRILKYLTPSSFERLSTKSIVANIPAYSDHLDSRKQQPPQQTHLKHVQSESPSRRMWPHGRIRNHDSV